LFSQYTPKAFSELTTFGAWLGVDNAEALISYAGDLFAWVVIVPIGIIITTKLFMKKWVNTGIMVGLVIMAAALYPIFYSVSDYFAPHGDYYNAWRSHSGFHPLVAMLFYIAPFIGICFYFFSFIMVGVGTNREPWLFSKIRRLDLTRLVLRASPLLMVAVLWTSQVFNIRSLSYKSQEELRAANRSRFEYHKNKMKNESQQMQAKRIRLLGELGADAVPDLFYYIESGKTDQNALEGKAAYEALNKIASQSLVPLLQEMGFIYRSRFRTNSQEVIMKIVRAQGKDIIPWLLEAYKSSEDEALGVGTAAILGRLKESRAFPLFMRALNDKK